MLDWLSGIKEGITNLPTLIFTNFREPLLNLASYILDLPDKIFNALKDTLGKILDFLKFLPDNIWEFFKDAFNGILNLVKKGPTTVYNLFKDVLDNIKSGLSNLPTTVYNVFKNILEGIKMAIGAVAGAVYDFFSPAIEFIKGILNNIIEFWKGLANLITNAVKRVFIPDDGVIESIMDRLKANFNGLLVSYDLKGLVTSGKMFSDITITMNKKTMTVVDSFVIDTAIKHFRPIIRGFMVLLLILFNVNQFLAFIGQPAISIVGGLQALQKSEKGGTNE